MTRSNPSLPGTIGRYEVLRRLGQGAMGRVVLAHDPVLDRVVAIKMLRDDLGLDEEHKRQLFERMRQEARASARIAHPNIVALFDMGEDAGLGLFLVFEYVKGATLKDQIGVGALDPTDVAQLCRELGSALTTAHEASVLHRDIKPENVILSSIGAKIADFGIARLPESTLTRDGRLLGTPAYSSPESISRGEFSPASDQFSLAATLYEAISRDRAFPGDDAVAVATRITTEQPAPIAGKLGLSPSVDQVLFRALSKDPSGRYASCADFGAALSEALMGSSRALLRLSVPSVSHSSLSREQVIGRKPTRIIAGAATLGAIVMALVLQATRSCQRPIAEDSAASVQTAAPIESLEIRNGRGGPPAKPLRLRGRSESISPSTPTVASTSSTAQ